MVVDPTHSSRDAAAFAATAALEVAGVAARARVLSRDRAVLRAELAARSFSEAMQAEARAREEMERWQGERLCALLLNESARSYSKTMVLLS